jgi:hypothetical protein
MKTSTNPTEPVKTVAPTVFTSLSEEAVTAATRRVQPEKYRGRNRPKPVVIHLGFN